MRRTTSLWHLGVSLAALSTPAFAQETTAGADEEIVVTAQRRSEALEKVPMTVTVISQDTLTSAGVNSIRDLQNVTSGFQVGNSGSYPQPAIRGITTTNAGAYENNVAVFVDGLYQTTPQVLNMDLPNVHNIQVLKGPQGTLYGRNATGGAILLDTIDPGKTWEGNIEATYGRFADKRARGYVAGPVSEGIGFSLAGTVRHTDGYYKKASRTAPGQFDGRFLGLKQESARAKLKIEPVDGLRTTFGYNYTRASDPRGVIFTPIENVQLPYTAPGNNTRPRGLGEAAGDVFVLDFKQHEGLFKVEYDTGIGTLRSVAGYTSGRLTTTFDFGGSYVPDNYSTSIIRDRTWQENLDFNINTISWLNLVVGATYYHIKTDYDPNGPNSVYLGPANYRPFTYPDPATTIVPLSSYRHASDTFFFRTKKAWAVFADATFHITDRLSVDVGARYSKETQNVSGLKNNFCADPLSPATLNCTLGAVVSTPYTVATSARRSSYPKFTPRAAIRYEIAPRTNIYASYSRGFRGGEWNSVIPNDNPANWRDAKQETVDAYELGFKSRGHRYGVELAGFYYDYKDLQVSFTQNVGGVALVILQNAPKAKIYGIDASADYELVKNLKIRAGATWLHARYGNRFYFTGSGVDVTKPAFSTGSDPLMNFQNVTAAQDLSGLQMARAPNFSGFIGFDYLIPHGDGGIRFGANVKYTTSYVVTNPSVWGGESVASYNARLLANPAAAPNNSALLSGTPYVGRASQQRARQGAFALVNASVTWTDPHDHYYVRIWGNNITNAKYRTHYNPLSNGTYAPIGEPFTIGGTIGYKFAR
jgi:iron complex outermembrane receptor protein